MSLTNLREKTKLSFLENLRTLSNSYPALLGIELNVLVLGTIIMQDPTSAVDWSCYNLTVHLGHRCSWLEPSIGGGAVVVIDSYISSITSKNRG